jgi:hypothetical protein
MDDRPHGPSRFLICFLGHNFNGEPPIGSGPEELLEPYDHNFCVLGSQSPTIPDSETESERDQPQQSCTSKQSWPVFVWGESPSVLVPDTVPQQSPSVLVPDSVPQQSPPVFVPDSVPQQSSPVFIPDSVPQQSPIVLLIVIDDSDDSFCLVAARSAATLWGNLRLSVEHPCWF